MGTVSLQQLDLENCANLREVQVSEASQRPSLLGGGGRAGEGGDSAAPKVRCCCEGAGGGLEVQLLLKDAPAVSLLLGPIACTPFLLCSGR